MSLQLDFHWAVDGDVLEALQYYDKRSHSLGDAYLAEVKCYWSEIAATPKQFGIIDFDIMVAQLISFPYLIYFQERGTSVYIIAVLHYARDPEVWRSRR